VVSPLFSFVLCPGGEPFGVQPINLDAIDPLILPLDRSSKVERIILLRGVRFFANPPFPPLSHSFSHVPGHR
jgi:hypothetical protein